MAGTQFDRPRSGALIALALVALLIIGVALFVATQRRGTNTTYVQPGTDQRQVIQPVPMPNTASGPATGPVDSPRAAGPDEAESPNESAGDRLGMGAQSGAMQGNGMGQDNLHSDTMQRDNMQSGKMHGGDLASSGNYDQDWLDNMIEHHRGAIEMSQEALSRSSRPEIKNLSRKIINDQQREIDQMQKLRRQWFGTAS